MFCEIYPYSVFLRLRRGTRSVFQLLGNALLSSWASIASASLDIFSREVLGNRIEPHPAQRGEMPVGQLAQNGTFRAAAMFRETLQQTPFQAQMQFRASFLVGLLHWAPACPIEIRSPRENSVVNVNGEMGLS